MKKIIVLVTILTSVLLMPMYVLQYSTAQQTTGSVTILSTCGLSFVSGAPINYGSLLPNATSANQTLTLDNTGTITGTLSINGSNWKDVSSISHILVNFTKYTGKTTTTPYASKISLTSVPTVTGIISPSVNNATTWQLKAQLFNLPFTGSLTQTMDFSLTC